MFTGIVEHMGKVNRVESTPEGKSIVIDATLADIPIGGSVAVNGACLTLVEHTSAGARFDVIPETLRRTNLGSLEAGDTVNLELPMRADGRFDGHIVQGHVDGIGEVVSVDFDSSGGVMMTVSVPPQLQAHVVEKGSVAIDGVSLTVAAVEGDNIQVALIPHTLEVTTLGERRAGDTVNLETDVLAKYVERLVEARR